MGHAVVHDDAPRGNHTVHGHFWVPIDDENCWAWSFDYRPDRDITPVERQACGISAASTQDAGQHLANKDNDYLIDREAQKAGRTFSGAEGIGMQDASLQEHGAGRRSDEEICPDRQWHHHGASLAARREGVQGQGRRAAGRRRRA